MRLIIQQILEHPDATGISLVYRSGNHVARKLYAKLGFIEQGADELNRTVAKLSLEK